MTYSKKLIEVALPLEAINRASVRESYIYKGNPSSLHKWWAQRPLAAARAVIFASLVDDPDDPKAPKEFVDACKALPKGRNAAQHDTPRQRLFDFIEVLVQWESTTDKQVLDTAHRLIDLATNGNLPPFLDPFAGGGTIPLEAQRLGLEATASDLNPVAVTINKALIEIPSGFCDRLPVNPLDQERTKSMGEQWVRAQGLASDVRYYGQRLRSRAWEEIGHLYPVGPNDETVNAWLWARTVKSPNPAIDAHVPLVRSFWLSNRKGSKAWVEPEIDPASNEISFVVRQGDGEAPSPTVGRGGATCIVTGTPITLEYIRSEGQSGQIGSKLMAIVTQSEGGKKFYGPLVHHEEAAAQAHPEWGPEYEMSTHPQYMSAPRYGLTTFASIFTPRQLTTLSTLSKLLDVIREEVYADALSAGFADDGIPLRDQGTGALAYSEAVALYIAFAIDKYAPYGCALVPWYAKESRPSWLFGRQTISMIWDYTEVNPFSDIGGSLARSIELVADAVAPLGSKAMGRALQIDAAANIAVEGAIISTDPPYFDNVPYADLSDFFYVWLRRMLGGTYPDLFSTVLVPKIEELVADRVRRQNFRTIAKRD